MLVRPLPNWAMQRYARLWDVFGKKKFSYVEALKILKEASFLSVALSYMRKYGWMTITFHPDD
jgi:hypothetical protein